MVCDGRGISRFGAPFTYKRTYARARQHTQNLIINYIFAKCLQWNVELRAIAIFYCIRAIAGTLAAVFAFKLLRVFCPWCFVCLLFFSVRSRHNHHHHQKQQQRRWQYFYCLVIVIGFLSWARNRIAELSMENGVKRMQVRLWLFPQDSLCISLNVCVWHSTNWIQLRKKNKRKIITNRSAQINDLWPIIG